VKKLPFIGRHRYLEKLRQMLNKKSATLAVVKGRRRIGKSRLIQEFSKDYQFYEFVGLSPDEGITEQDQRDNFARLLEKYFQLPPLRTTDWSDLLTVLAENTANGQVNILFDEISWMAMDSPTFLPKLKNAWDTEFKNNHQLTLILCGSVSVWIEKNILSSTGYFGRIPVRISLDELPLPDCNELLHAQNFVGGTYDKFQLLAVTGGIPYYLEQLQPGFTAEQNIRQLCFYEDALFVNEFDLIFHDVFNSRSDIYKKIVMLLADGSMEYNDVCDKLQYSRSGKLYDYLNDLIVARFISRDYTWSIKSGKVARLSKYRLSDNYLRFYLKYIAPKRELIMQGLYEDVDYMHLPGWQTTMGLQFENLVLKNKKSLLSLLGINPSHVVASNPFFQRKTTRQKGCQIDLLIQTRYQNLFVCEIKFSKNQLGMDIINEVDEKIKRLSLPRGFSCFPVLIHVNGVSDAVLDEGYFTKIIDFGELLVSSEK